MRWMQPTRGDSRDRKGFLLFPKTINNETRWLEWAKWGETLEETGHDEPTLVWVADDWMDDEEK